MNKRISERRFGANATRVDRVLGFPGIQLMLTAMSLPIVHFGTLQFFIFGGHIPRQSTFWYPWEVWIPLSLFIFCHIQATVWFLPDDENWVRRSTTLASVWFTIRICSNNVAGLRGLMNGFMLYAPWLIVIYVFTNYLIRTTGAFEALESIQQVEGLRKQHEKERDSE